MTQTIKVALAGAGAHVVAVARTKGALEELDDEITALGGSATLVPLNLVHGDMRLANLLIDNGAVKVIDFDDCGFSWLMYDCATTVSFFEHEPGVPELLDAWVRGYRRITDLPADDAAEIPTFVMLRRLLLVAWIGSHAETDLAQSMGVRYTSETTGLCEAYLGRFG